MLHTADKLRLALDHVNEGEAIHARGAFENALLAYDAKDYATAHRWAERSLLYSVGKDHPAYLQAVASVWK